MKIMEDIMDLQGKKVLVVGSGLSGIGAVQALHHAGAAPLLFDENEKLNAEEVRRKLPSGTYPRVSAGR